MNIRHTSLSILTTAMSVAAAFALPLLPAEAQGATLSKSQCLVSATPSEGSINLAIYSGGPSYIQLVMSSVPTIDRSLESKIELLYEADSTPVATIDPSDSKMLFVQTQGIANEYENLVHLYFTDGIDIVTPGKYTVVIPQGLFSFENGDINAEIKLNYTVPTLLSYTIWPRQDLSLTSLERFTLIFDEAEKVAVSGAATPTLVRTYPPRTLSGASEASSNIATITFDRMKQSGDYTLRIPAGTFTVTVDGKEYPNQLLEFFYQTNDYEEPMIVPARGALKSNVIDKITLVLDDDDEITYILPGNSFNRLMRSDDKGNIDYSHTIEWFDAADPINEQGGNTVTLRPRSGNPVTLTPGNYAFISARYLYTIKGGYTANEYKYFWTLLPASPSLPAPTLITPEAGYYNAPSIITLSLPGNEEISSVSFYSCNVCEVEPQGSYGPYAFSMIATPGEKSGQLRLIPVGDISNIASGNYMVRLPEGLYTTPSGISAEYDIRFSIGAPQSGISTAKENPTSNSAIYNMWGVKVADNSTPEIINSLPQGIYITAGRKIAK